LIIKAFFVVYFSLLFMMTGFMVSLYGPNNALIDFIVPLTICSSLFIFILDYYAI